MNAREDILAAIRGPRATGVPALSPYRGPASPDPVEAFAERAARANAEVRLVASEAELPQAIAELLRARNLPAVVHVPRNAANLLWDSAPGLTLEDAPPGPEDAAVAIAAFGVAETGTLAYPSRRDAPASWHFRAGFEIAVLHGSAIVPHMEEVLAQLKASGLPSTVNFVTGPSRTGDIEQTLELGAHGPKALAILIVQN